MGFPSTILAATPWRYPNFCNIFAFSCLSSCSPRKVEHASVSLLASQQLLITIKVN